MIKNLRNKIRGIKLRSSFSGRVNSCWRRRKPGRLVITGGEQELYPQGLPTSGGSRILCLWWLMGRVFLFGGLMGNKRRRRETAIAEGKKPLTTRGSGERRELPQRGLGRSPRNRRNFEHFKRKWSTFLDPVNITFLNN